MLVVFKSAPILKRTLKVKHAMLQLYVLKLLKMQTKYLGRQWRKSNMKTMSAIYSKVRHRLNDDWAYGNGQCSFKTQVDSGMQRFMHFQTSTLGRGTSRLKNVPSAPPSTGSTTGGTTRGTPQRRQRRPTATPAPRLPDSKM